MNRADLAFFLTFMALFAISWAIPQSYETAVPKGSVVVASIDTSKKAEDLLGLDPGSQRAVSAPILFEDSLETEEDPGTSDFSTVMHDLTKHMVGLNIAAQNEVAWLASALANGAGGDVSIESTGSLSENLNVVASALDHLSAEDRRLVIDLAASLAVPKGVSADAD